MNGNAARRGSDLGLRRWGANVADDGCMCICAGRTRQRGDEMCALAAARVSTRRGVRCVRPPRHRCALQPQPHSPPSRSRAQSIAHRDCVHRRAGDRILVHGRRVPEGESCAERGRLGRRCIGSRRR
eukprot:2321368-Prymnesium_polylepis.3